MNIPSRNAPCPCGSGRRYKDCHGALAAASPTTTTAAIAEAHFHRGNAARDAG
ncbi:MAG: SEC-C metal-binding domain-containing protein, partial [Betaproteobacteria bacterium]